MKCTRVIIIFLSVAVWLSLTACSAKSDQSSANSSSKNSVNTADAQKTDEKKTDAEKTDTNQSDTEKTDADQTDINQADTVQTDMQKTDVQETDVSDECIEQYKAFLRGEISSQTKDEEVGPQYLKGFCNTVIPEEDDEVIHCALYDMTGDGVPELHLLTDSSYTIHTVRKGQLITWYEGDRYNRPLNNGMVYEKIESTGTHYAYQVLDSEGEEIFYVGFSTPPEGLEKKWGYLFSTGDDNVNLTKREFNKVAKRFLKMKSDKIIWKQLKEFLD